MKIEDLKNRHPGGRALLVLGGPSSTGWAALRAQVQPDIILGVNGVNSLIGDLDYWIMMENMQLAKRLKAREKNAQAFMEMINRAGARIRILNYKNEPIIRDVSNCIFTNRKNFKLDRTPAAFSFREFGGGLLIGGLSVHPEAWQPGISVSVGTVAAQALHVAGVLGCSEIHTIGLDLLFRETQHAYPYPIYEVDRYRSEKMFVTYKGVDTQWIWIETAAFLKSLEPFLVRDGIRWIDHSDGLLKIEGLQCAN